jgi:hypothetical protein
VLRDVLLTVRPKAADGTGRPGVTRLVWETLAGLAFVYLYLVSIAEQIICSINLFCDCKQTLIHIILFLTLRGIWRLLLDGETGAKSNIIKQQILFMYVCRFYE